MSMTLELAVERIVELERQMADVLKRLDEPAVKPAKETKAAKKSPKGTKAPAGKRGPSGYNLFVKDQGMSIVEAAKKWKGLSDSAREKWNAKARG